eukprot:7230760-Alexandrium_andersonii.AAC.1
MSPPRKRLRRALNGPRWEQPRWSTVAASQRAGLIHVADLQLSNAHGPAGQAADQRCLQQQDLRQ